LYLRNQYFIKQVTFGIVYLLWGGWEQVFSGGTICTLDIFEAWILRRYLNYRNHNTNPYNRFTNFCANWPFR